MQKNLRFPQLFNGKADSPEVAYELLQKFVKRYKKNGTLLSKRELDRISDYRSRLVLTTTERYLLDMSQDAKYPSTANKVILFSSLGILLLVIGAIGFLWFNSNQPSIPQHQAIHNDQVAPVFVDQKRPATAAVMQAKTPSNISPATVPEENTILSESAAKEQAEKEELKTVVPSGELLIVESSEEVLPVQSNTRETAITSGEKTMSSLEGEYDRIFPFPAQPDVYLIEKNGRQGLVRPNGKIIVYPYFERIKSYYPDEQLIIVMNNGKAGVYNERGQQFAIGIEYHDICCLSEGLFGVQTDNGKWGFVDRWGNTILPASYDSIEEPFKNGRAIVIQEGKKMAIDLSGNFIASN